MSNMERFLPLCGMLVVGIIFGVGPFSKAKCTSEQSQPYIINTDYTQPKQPTQPAGSDNNSNGSNNSGNSGGYNNGGYVPPINVQQPQQKWYNCANCGGSGKHSLCNGSGRHMCRTCNGTGQHYNTYTGFYERCINTYCSGGYTNCSCSGGLCPSCGGSRGSYY